MRLFIGGMSAATKYGDLRDHFDALDGVEVVDVVIIMDKTTGRSRGFGFVELNTPHSVDYLIERTHGTKIAGSERTITVGEAHKRPEKEDRRVPRNAPSARRYEKTRAE